MYSRVTFFVTSTPLVPFRYKASAAIKLEENAEIVVSASGPTVALVMDTFLTSAARALFTRMNIDIAQSDAHQVRDFESMIQSCVSTGSNVCVCVCFAGHGMCLIFVPVCCDGPQLSEFRSRITYLAFASERKSATAYINKMIVQFQHLSITSAVRVGMALGPFDAAAGREFCTVACNSSGAFCQLVNSTQLCSFRCSPLSLLCCHFCLIVFIICDPN